MTTSVTIVDITWMQNQPICIYFDDGSLVQLEGKNAPGRALFWCSADTSQRGVISQPVAKFLEQVRAGFLGREAAQVAYRLLEAYPIATGLPTLPEDTQTTPLSPFALVEWD